MNHILLFNNTQRIANTNFLELYGLKTKTHKTDCSHKAISC